jgi:tetratricopeptide (TPR) repeat protein
LSSFIELKAPRNAGLFLSLGMKKYLLPAFIYFISIAACQTAVQCPEGINLEPEYGNQIKCPEQIQIDKEFINECKKVFPTMDSAYSYHIEAGWDYFRKNDTATAMKRFNQAWLINKKNEGSYWGFGTLLGLRHDFERSKYYFDKALAIDDTNPNLLNDASTTYFQYSFETKDPTYTTKGIDLLIRSIGNGSQDKAVYAQLAKAYYYLQEKDSASKYLSIATVFTPQLIPEDLTQLIKELP